MEFKFTPNQEEIFQEMLEPTAPVTLIKAHPGSSKSTSLIEGSRRVMKASPETKIRYLIFGKVQSDEAKVEFGHTAIVSTLHSLAYSYTVPGSPLKLSDKPFISWRDIPKTIKIPFGKTDEVLEHLSIFCNSSHISLVTYCTQSKLPKEISVALYHVYEGMRTGKIPCLHEFYLKIFHILLMNDDIKLPEVDKLLVDEAADLSIITLDVVKKFPAKQKILVGDPNQSIMGFMGCINAFDEFPEAKTITLPQTFRVSAKLTPDLKRFGTYALEPDMDFIGFDYPTSPRIKTKAYLVRSNMDIVDKMIEYNIIGKPYRLATKTKIAQLFEVPLALMRTKPGNKEKNPKYKLMQELADKWANTPHLQAEYGSRLSYLADLLSDNPDIKKAIAIITKYRGTQIIEAYENAKSHMNNACDFWILTAHSSKGLTFDAVYLDNSMNTTIEDAMEKLRTEEELEEADLQELRLYWVAISRCRHKLENAIWLDVLRTREEHATN